MACVNDISKCTKRLVTKTAFRVTSKRSRKCLLVTILTLVVVGIIRGFVSGSINITVVNDLYPGVALQLNRKNHKLSDKQLSFKDLTLSRNGVEISVGAQKNSTGEINNSNQTNPSQNEYKKQNDGKTEMSNISTKLNEPETPTLLQYFGVHELDTEIDRDGFKTFCAVELNRYKYLPWPDTPTDFEDWSFANRRKCPKFVINDKIKNTTRMKYSLSCDTGKAQLIPSKTNSSSNVDVVNSNHTCLHKFINSCCRNNEDVPNVIHYVWYFKRAMKFDTFLSILSVVRFVRPCLILFHGEYLPFGIYWDYIIRLYPNIIHVKTLRPLTIFGKKIHHHEHSGDVMRIEALMLGGGIYLDTDVIALRDLKPLRKYDVTMCNQAGGQFLLNSFIMSKKNATFLTLWLEGYRKDYRNDSYVYNSMVYNKALSLKYPNLIHVENGTMCCPDEFLGVDFKSPMIYKWTNLYGFHMYSRQIDFPWSVDFIRHFNTTFGSMLRHVVYGNKELCL